MKTTQVVLSPVLSMVILAAGQAFAETTLVVNFGPHTSGRFPRILGFFGGGIACNRRGPC